MAKLPYSKSRIVSCFAVRKYCCHLAETTTESLSRSLCRKRETPVSPGRQGKRARVLSLPAALVCCATGVYIPLACVGLRPPAASQDA